MIDLFQILITNVLFKIEITHIKTENGITAVEFTITCWMILKTYLP